MFEQTVWEIILTLVFIVDKFLLKILRSVVCLLIKYYNLCGIDSMILSLQQINPSFNNKLFMLIALSMPSVT